MERLRNLFTVIVFVSLVIILYIKKTENNDITLKAVIKRISTQNNYIEQIKDLCGDLCDVKKEITPGDFMGSVKAKVIPKFQSKHSLFHFAGRL